MIYETIIRILSEVFDKDPQEITQETRIVEDLGAESIDFLELAMLLEEEFSIELSPEKAFLQDFKTIYNNALLEGRDPFEILKIHYSYLGDERIRHHMQGIGRESTLSVKDLILYIKFQKSQ